MTRYEKEVLFEPLAAAEFMMDLHYRPRPGLPARRSRAWEAVLVALANAMGPDQLMGRYPVLDLDSAFVPDPESVAAFEDLLLKAEARLN